MRKFLEWIKNHRTIVTFLLIVLTFLGFIVPQIFLQLPWSIENHTSGVELIALCSQIISAFFVIIGTVIAVWQYYLSSNQNIYEFKFKKVDKAIELSGYYKDNILNKYSFVKNVFSEVGLMDIIQPKRKDKEIQHFDTDELNDIYTKEEIKKFEELFFNDNFAKSIIRISKMYDFELRDYCVCEENGEIVFQDTSKPKEILAEFHKKYIVEMLNNAEYFAMYFTHNIADESVIFQSIYPTYLEMCFIMYYYIARHSSADSPKLYTNVAKLYCVWRQKSNQQMKKIKKQSEENMKHSRGASKDFGTVV